MRQPDLCALRRVAALSHPFDVRRERLTYSLVIVEHSNLFADELRHPDRHSVSSRARAADIEEQAERHQWIRSNTPNPSRCAGCRQILGVISALNDLHVVAFPN